MNDPTGHIYGRRLKAAREAAELTQDRLAELVGVSRRTLAHWEAGTKHPEFGKLQVVANAVQQPLAFFFAEEDVEPKPGEPTTRDLMQRLDAMERRLERLLAASEGPGRPGLPGSKAAS